MRYLDAEDSQIASRFTFLSMAITVLEQDLDYINNGPFKIKEPYLTLVDMMISSAKSERKKLRKMMYNRNLTVIRTRKSDLFTTYLFICNRREEERTYFNPAIRMKVKDIILDLLENLQQHDDNQTTDHGIRGDDVNVDSNAKAQN